MDRQQIFNKVYESLSKQRKQSLMPGANSYTCAYMDDDGNKCAVGHLLPEALFKEPHFSNIRTMPARELIEYCNTNVDEELNTWVRDYLNQDGFLATLQEVHDVHMRYGEWNQAIFNDRMAIVAKIYSLNMPELIV